MKKLYLKMEIPEFCSLEGDTTEALRESYLSLFKLNNKQFIFLKDKRSAIELLENQLISTNNNNTIFFEVLVHDDDINFKALDVQAGIEKYSAFQCKFIPEKMIVTSTIGLSDNYCRFNAPVPHRVPEQYCGFFKKNTRYENYFYLYNSEKRTPSLKQPLATIQGTQKLFSDYSSMFKRIFHWNRHHHDTANTIVNALDDFDNAKDALNYLIDMRSTLLTRTENKARKSGSIIRRLDFAIANLTQLISSDESTPQILGNLA